MLLELVITAAMNLAAAMPALATRATMTVRSASCSAGGASGALSMERPEGGAGRPRSNRSQFQAPFSFNRQDGSRHGSGDHEDASPRILGAVPVADPRVRVEQFARWRN